MLREPVDEEPIPDRDPHTTLRAYLEELREAPTAPISDELTPFPDTIPGHLRNIGLNHPLTATVLRQRGLDDPVALEHLLSDRLPDWSDDPTMILMADTLRTILAASDPHAVFVHGDADVDGMLSCRIVTKALTGLAQFGGRTGLSIQHYAPSRIRRWFEAERVPPGTQTLILLDQALPVAEIDRLPTTVHTVLHIDHHADAPHDLTGRNILSLNARSLQSNLSAAGMAYLLVRELFADATPATKKARQQLDTLLSQCLQLACVGTVADVSPMTAGDARALVRHGLDTAFHGPGRRYSHRDMLLRHLCAATHTSAQHLTAGDIAFRLAPPLNALGRMDSQDTNTLRAQVSGPDDPPKDSLEQAIAFNDARKDRQQTLVEQVLPALAEGVPPRPVELFEADVDYAIGGPLASQLADILGVVVGVATHPSPSETYISWRAPDHCQGIDLGRTMQDLAADIGYGSRGGGHALAAGISPAGGAQVWNPDRLDDLRYAAEQRLAPAIHTPDRTPDLVLDAAGLASLPTLASDLWRLQPFGSGHEPLRVRLRAIHIDQAFSRGDSPYRHLQLLDADGHLHHALVHARDAPDDEDLGGLRADLDLRVEPASPTRLGLFADRVTPA